ncbi:MAG: 16S rRNA (adenine(1518)-N(6)/adenine(1519)-N(6))-dimethyltransferase RsmA [Candidatus Omnitrophica bacterium]|nr:16S rRNA (adenine(1518)-N(6)/adenine(1519)-N(6))-dimethyltransferase RsmA [Candidatus Omnitrophota bacterium]MCM8793450.1 16S rRNA (adenine(1518)-N(6)/adenine(1519)-N(6))-dimethyltransferase RsmA [Candidatus Omnitrophota bacterium]
MLSLSELTKLLELYNLSPKKFLGQHFLIDKNIQEKIIANCQISNEDVVLEIGPGLGALTEELCRKAKFVYAIEKDELFCNLLKERFKLFKNLRIINDDILKFRLPPQESPKHRLKVIGNLPYYISTPILTYLLKNRQHISSIYISLQKELAQRIIARPGSKNYGALTIFVNFYTKPEILFPIKRTCFYPRPEVDSCFLRIKILIKPKVNKQFENLFFSIVRLTFQKRRKKILNALLKSKLGLKKEEWERIFKDIGIQPQRRPENLSIEDFFNLTDHLLKR